MKPLYNNLVCPDRIWNLVVYADNTISIYMLFGCYRQNLTKKLFLKIFDLKVSTPYGMNDNEKWPNFPKECKVECMVKR